MASTPRMYRRLRGTFLFRWASLHLGPDHLLQVTHSGFSESYRRYFFQDIQAVTLYHTVAGRLWSAAWCGLASLFVLIGVAAGGDALAPLVSMGAFWLIPLAINLILGPTCICYVKTAVQTQRLLSLSRVRQARRAIEQFRPLIQQAQGEMSIEEVSRRLDGALAAATYPGPRPPVT